jgi:hypothetical protein
LVHRKRQIHVDFVRIEETAFTNFANEHLDENRLERLAKALVDEALGSASASDSLAHSLTQARELAADRAHADYCPGCKASVETVVVAEMRFRKMLSSMEVTHSVRTPECPPEQIWAKVATGLIPDREAAPWISHAAECGFCGSLLREATEDLAVEATPEELQQIQALLTPEWRGKMARAMSAAASGGPFQGPALRENASTAEQPAAGWLDWLRRRLR